MKPLPLSARLLAAAGAFATVALAGPPNVVVILADDMGYSDVGCFGSEIATPNLDRLAQKGVRFTQFYNAGRCCPSRASLLTGRYSHRVGIGHMTGDLGDPAYRGFLRASSLTIAEALKPAGYRSYMVGKWHLGDGPGRWPTDHGFDRFYGSPTSPGNYFRNEAGRPPLQLDGRPVSTGEGWYATDAFTDHAIQFVREHANATPGQPFFLYVAYTAPHWPCRRSPPTSPGTAANTAKAGIISGASVMRACWPWASCLPARNYPRAMMPRSPGRTSPGRTRWNCAWRSTPPWLIAWTRTSAGSSRRSTN